MQLIQQYVQKSRTTSLPRSWEREIGDSVFSQSSPARKSGALTFPAYFVGTGCFSELAELP
jgi:hypothetical protein